MAHPAKDNRRSPRQYKKGAISFKILTNPVVASNVNYSETGVCFNTAPPLEIEFTLGETDGEGKPMRGRLIWARKLNDGTFAYGFEYCGDGEGDGPPSGGSGNREA